MVNELLSIGVNSMGKTIKELQIEVSEIILKHYMDCHYGKRYIAGNSENNRIDRYNQKRVIIHHLKYYMSLISLQYYILSSTTIHCRSLPLNV